jgi:general secretion pathway protein G
MLTHIAHGINRKKDGTRDLADAFTLIEVMIVMLIGGLIMAAAFAGFRFYASAKINETDRKLAALDTVLESYHIRMSEYPDSLNQLVEGPTKPNLVRKWAESMAQESDLRDAWNQPLVYERTANGYDLYSKGSKGTSQQRSARSKE